MILIAKIVERELYGIEEDPIDEKKASYAMATCIARILGVTALSNSDPDDFNNNTYEMVLPLKVPAGAAKALAELVDDMPTLVPKDMNILTSFYQNIFEKGYCQLMKETVDYIDTLNKKGD